MKTILGLTSEELKAKAKEISWEKARELTHFENRLEVIENSILGNTAIIISIGHCCYVVWSDSEKSKWFIV